jgi:hypothetical protein
MNIKNEAEKIVLTSMPRRFVRHVLNFFVGLGIGLAPFLGTKNILGFRALISVMPFQIKSELITISAFLMGLIVVAVQFYSAERISGPALVKRFGWALAAMGVGFVLFYHLRNEFTVDVERGSTTVTVLIGSAPRATRKACGCPNPADEPEACIKTLSFNAEAIQACWDYREIRRRGELLGFSYLILTGGVALLIGFLLLQEEARRQAKTKKARPRGRKGKPSAPAAPKAPAAEGAPSSPEPPPQGEPPPEPSHS